MNFSNILGLSDDNNNLNTILIIIIILFIILGFGNNNQVCGYTFGCFNPANLAGLSPESTDRKKCCEPCCRPYCPGGGIFGGSFLWILIAIFVLCFCFKKDDHDDHDECDPCC